MKDKFERARDIILAKPDSHKLKEAKLLLEIAAREGYAPAQYYLYSFLWMDRKCIQDEFKALEWCEKAAYAGYAPAQYDYALHLIYGDGIKCDRIEAAAWLERAAFKKYRLAAQKLSSLYNAGNRIEKNKEKATFWKNIESEQINIRKNISLSNYNFAKEMTAESFYSEPGIQYVTEFTPASLNRIILSENFESFVVDIKNQERIIELIIGKIRFMLQDGFDMEYVNIITLNNKEKKFIQDNLKDIADKIEECTVQNLKVPRISTFGYLLNNLKKYIAETVYDKEPSISIEYINSLTYKDRLIFISNFIEHNPEISKKCTNNWEYVIFNGVKHYSKEELLLLETLLKQLNCKGCGYIILCNNNFQSLEACKNRNLRFVSIN